jgi:signal transduction histidine kinase
LNNLQVKVVDTGVGISKEYMPSLFNPFSQEEQGYTRTYEGTDWA